MNVASTIDRAGLAEPTLNLETLAAAISATKRPSKLRALLRQKRGIEKIYARLLMAERAEILGAAWSPNDRGQFHLSTESSDESRQLRWGRLRTARLRVFSIKDYERVTCCSVTAARSDVAQMISEGRAIVGEKLTNGTLIYHLVQRGNGCDA